MTRKPKPVRCWMIKRHKYPIQWLVLRDPTKSRILCNQEMTHTITPGHFVPEVKKARRK